MRFAFLFLLVLVVGCAKRDVAPEPRPASLPESEAAEMEKFTVTSTAFQNNAMIPSKYTCDGADVNPPLVIAGLPKAAQSLVLIVDDPDAPAGTWDHWIVWNIPPGNAIDEDSVPGTQGVNSFRTHEYGGPCPPSGTHRYFFKVYALDARLSLSDSSGERDVENAMKGHILAKAELMGLYKRG
jgi:Raf kinase inhibitor-like YbhB/YbcL family protein